MLTFCKIESKSKNGDESEKESEEPDERVFRLNEELEHGNSEMKTKIL